MASKVGKTVLILEDDLELSDVIDRILKSLDPTIVLDWCTSAEEAINRLQQAIDSGETSPYHLIISDIYLDGEKNGLDLRRFCIENHLNVNIVFMSAADQKKIFPTKNSNSEPPLLFLQKPFSVSELSKLFEKLL